MPPDLSDNDGIKLNNGDDGGSSDNDTHRMSRLDETKEEIKK